jgi:ABC-type multidrug transport system permease subunit
LKSLIGATVGYVLCLGLYLVLRAEYYMENIVSMNPLTLARGFIIWYVIVLIIFAVISILFYGWKYADTQKRVRWYYKDLKDLDAMNHVTEDGE